jgi:hypothetical protein
MFLSKRRWSLVFTVICALIGLSVFSPQLSTAQTIPTRYFPETGHYSKGAFLSFWERNGGTQIFGLPITEEYMRRSDGKVVQYYERARFELRVVGNQAIIDLGLLGRELTTGRNFGTIAAIPNTASQRYFPETGHSIRGSFKQFWESRGGVAIFGYPISEEISEPLSDGQSHRVQYFERARFELHGSSINLGLLGRSLAPCALTAPLPPNAAPSQALEEPRDNKPCNSDATMRGRAYPSPSLPGTVLGFEAYGYAADEKVSLWLNLPDGSTRPLPYQAIAGNDGGVLIGFRTEESDPVGSWSIVGYGNSSQRQVVATFELRR